MSDIPADLYYTEEHEYLKSTGEDGVYAVGITDYAQGELGDVVFVELPDGGAQFGQMDVFGTIEAVKAVSDLYCPLEGEIVVPSLPAASWGRDSLGGCRAGAPLWCVFRTTT